jgi:hypothetical protein
MKLPRPARQDRLLWSLLALTLLASLWLATRGWDRPLLDRHEFRQIQTAIGAYWIREEGYRLDYETPLFGPPWSFPLEFPTYQLIVGKLSAWTGADLETTGRAVNLAFLLAGLPAVYGLAGVLGLAPSRRALVVAAVLCAPVHLFYARTFMIESAALCFSLWFLYALVRSAHEARAGWPPLALLFGVLAALTKTTTFLIFLGPAVLAAWALPVAPGRAMLRGGRRLFAPVIPVTAALAAAFAWVRHADAVKHSNPFTGFLASTELAKWNWGTLEQRLSSEFWIELWRNVSGFVLAEIALVPVVVAAVVAPAPLRRVALAAAAAFFAGAVLFPNLFHIHDYYYFANTSLLLFGCGILLASLWDQSGLPPAVRHTLVAVFFGAQFLIFHRGYADYLRREPVQPPGLAEVIRTTTPRDGVILIYGWDWKGLLPYYAERRAIMVPDGRHEEFAVLEDVVRQLPPRRIVGVVVATDPLRRATAYVRGRTDRFHLGAAPLASGPEGDFYLAEDLIADARRALAGRAIAGVELNLGGAPAAPAASRPVEPSLLAGGPFSPAPRAGRTLFGMSLSELDGSPVLNAHAPSELEFVPPPETRSIRAVYGLPDAAWNGGPAVTDGIGVEVFERLPNGQQRPLFRRTLDPAREPRDRGPQTLQLDDAGPFSGELVFRFTTGTRDNTTNDWAYWRRVELR